MNPDLSDDRLRQVAQFSASKWAADAAREILRLREENAELAAALKALGKQDVTASP